MMNDSMKKDQKKVKALGESLIFPPLPPEKPARKKTRKPVTPRSKIKNALRMVWLRSRERALAIKQKGNTCECCNRKGSVAQGKEVKIQVHHKDGIGNWEAIIDMVYQQILCSPEHLEVLCSDCHTKKHQEDF